MTVHGATRHASAALLQFNNTRELKEQPSDEAALEVQQRHYVKKRPEALLSHGFERGRSGLGLCLGADATCATERRGSK